MGKRGLQPEKIIARLREAEVLSAQGQTVGQICRRFGIAEQTYYRWRKEYGGLRVDQAKRMKELEKESGGWAWNRSWSG